MGSGIDPRLPIFYHFPGGLNVEILEMDTVRGEFG